MSRTGAESRYYDEMYRSDDRTYENPRSSIYYPLFRKVLERVAKAQVGSVLEVGCGSGVLAQMLIGAGISYSGFDFSEVAVQKARALNPKGRFFVGDATDRTAYATPYEGIVCCEVLEHVEADLDAIRLWASGALCICSVPNFDYESHVRFFGTEREVVERYGSLIEIDEIERVPASARSGLTWRRYLRRLRWARNQPKRFLGMLGLNRFSWYGGWFVFVGRRR
jgi:SAM-dependent methyltransferase